MRAVRLTKFVAAVLTAMTLGTAAGHAHELEQVDKVFEHAIPNIPGKSLIAFVVTIPQAASHCPIAMPSRPSSTRMPGSTGPAKAFTSGRDRITG